MREYENLVCHLWPLTCSEAKLFAISQQGFNKISESVEEVESERLREALGLVGCVEGGEVGGHGQAWDSRRSCETGGTGWRRLRRASGRD